MQVAVVIRGASLISDAVIHSCQQILNLCLTLICYQFLVRIEVLWTVHLVEHQ